MNRIGINLLYINPKLAGGSVTYALKLVKEISELDQSNQYVIYINKDCTKLEFAIGSNFIIRVLNFEYSSVYLRYFWEQVILPYYLYIDKIDLVHSLGYVTPILTPVKKIVSILDINYKGHTNNMSAHKRFLLGTMVNLSAKFSKKIITISEFSKRQIVKHTNTKADKVVVTLLSGSSDLSTPNDINARLTTKKYKIKSSYIIAFSSPSPHKNMAKLIEAFYTVQLKQADLVLVLVGHQNKNNDLLNIINNYNLTEKVVFTGFVPDEDINPLIAGAKIFVFPSLYEGFGIPLLDAQACKVPVASSNAGSLPEVGGRAVKYFDPYSKEEIENAIICLLEDESAANKLSVLGLENRKNFSWKKTAVETINVYQELLKA